MLTSLWDFGKVSSHRQVGVGLFASSIWSEVKGETVRGHRTWSTEQLQGIIFLVSHHNLLCIFYMTAIQNIFCVAVFFHRSVENFIWNIYPSAEIANQNWGGKLFPELVWKALSHCHQEGKFLKWMIFQNSTPEIWALLHKTMVTLQLMISLQSMVTTIATLLHSQSKSRNQW